MEIIKLTARPRTGSGKSYTRKARAQGWMPAIYYGKKMDPVQLEVNQKEFATIVRNKKLTHLFNLGLGKTEDDSVAVVREFQRHVVDRNNYLHIDFHHVAMNEKVIVEVPLILEGIPVGVKLNGGVLEAPVKQVKVECMPLDIPENVKVDVSALDVGQSIHVRDVVISGLTLKDSSDEVLAVVTHATADAPATEVAAEAAAAAAPAKGAAPAKAAAAAPAKKK